MKEAHFILQGKGGVGKSFISTLIAQYLIDRTEDEIKCFDTDPVNPTFTNYEALKPTLVPILTQHNKIDTGYFDKFIEEIIKEEGIAVIDNGAATFVPLIQYIKEIDLFALFEELNIKVVIHTPVVGGQALQETLVGVSNILDLGKNFHVVAWINNFQGDVEKEKRFEDFLIVANNKDKIIGQVNLPARNPDTFGRDIRLMTEKSLTFDEVMKSSDFTLIPRQRLKQVRDDVYRQLDEIFAQKK